MRGLLLALLSALAIGGILAPGAAVAANTCPTKGGSYTVTAPAPSANATKGGDPAERDAVNCALGYHEKQEFPLSLIIVVLVFTLGTVVLLQREKVYDVLGSDA